MDKEIAHGIRAAAFRETLGIVVYANSCKAKPV